MTIRLVRLSDNVEKVFELLGSMNELAVQQITDHMNSLTDDLCENFFPDAKVKNRVEEKSTEVFDISQSPGLKQDALGLWVGKNGRFRQIGPEQFYQEVQRRHGKVAAESWKVNYES
jgi:hypothetical protein